MVRVVLPYQLQVLARTGTEVSLQVPEPVTTGAIIAALEARYPMLCGAVIDHNSGRRQPRLRFFACAEDWSFSAHDAPLPPAVAAGREPFVIVGAISGG